MGRAVAERLGRHGLANRLCLQPAANRDPIDVVRQRLREPQHDLVLVREIIDGDDADAAGRRHGNVVAVAKHGVAPGTGTDDRDRPERVGIDLGSGTEPQRDLLRRLLERGVRRDELSGIRKRGDEVERHHAALFELFTALQVAAAPLAPQDRRMPPLGERATDRTQPEGIHVSLTGCQTRARLFGSPGALDPILLVYLLDYGVSRSRRPAGLDAAKELRIDCLRTARRERSREIPATAKLHTIFTRPTPPSTIGQAVPLRIRANQGSVRPDRRAGRGAQTITASFWDREKPRTNGLP